MASDESVSVIHSNQKRGGQKAYQALFSSFFILLRQFETVPCFRPVLSPKNAVLFSSAYLSAPLRVDVCTYFDIRR